MVPILRRRKNEKPKKIWWRITSVWVAKKYTRLFLRRKQKYIIYISMIRELTVNFFCEINFTKKLLRKKRRKQKLHIFWCLCYIIIIYNYTELKQNTTGPLGQPTYYTELGLARGPIKLKFVQAIYAKSF